MDSRNIAIVQDALGGRGGAEQVLEAVLELFPHAPIFTLVYKEDLFTTSIISQHKVHTSFIQKLPFSKRFYREYLPLLPLAIEQFDLHEYPFILSLSYAVAHGILVQPEQIHVSYLFTPLRHAWYNYHTYLNSAPIKRGIAKWFAAYALSRFRIWDSLAAQRVDHFLAASKWVKMLAQKYYRREARILYPPVSLLGLEPAEVRKEYFLSVSRLVSYKRLHLMIEAFNQLGLPLKIVGEGRELNRLKRMANANVEFLGYLPRDQTYKLMREARAFIVAGVDDFNLSAVEAQAAGCPVIAYKRGGVCETVIEGQTGLFFQHPSAEALVEAVHRFIQMENRFVPEHLHRHAQCFSKQVFQTRLMFYLERMGIK